MLTASENAIITAERNFIAVIFFDIYYTSKLNDRYRRQWDNGETFGFKVIILIERRIAKVRRRLFDCVYLQRVNNGLPVLDAIGDARMTRPSWETLTVLNFGTYVERYLKSF